MSEDMLIRVIAKTILFVMVLLVLTILTRKWTAKKAREIKERTKEIDGEPIILVSPASGWRTGGYLCLTNSRIVLLKPRMFKISVSEMKRSVTLPLNTVKKYEAKYDSLKITTQLEHYSFNLGLDINNWLTKLRELLPSAEGISHKEITYQPSTIHEARTSITKMKKSYIIIGIILVIIGAFFIWSLSPTSYSFFVTVLPLTHYYVEIDREVITKGVIIEGQITTTETLKFYVKDPKDVIYSAGTIHGSHNFKFTAIRDGALLFFFENPPSTKTASVDLELTITDPELWPTGGIFFGIIVIVGLALIIFETRKALRKG